MWVRSVSRCYRPWKIRRSRLTFLILREKCYNSATVSLNVNPNPIISSEGWSDKSERYCRTVHCFQNIRFNKRTHPNELRRVQAVNEIGVGRGEEMCRKGCPYIRQLANRRREASCFRIVRPAVRVLPPLISVPCDAIFLYRMEAFLWNLQQIIIVWVGTAQKMFKVRGQRSRS